MSNFPVPFAVALAWIRGLSPATRALVAQSEAGIDAHDAASLKSAIIAVEPLFHFSPGEIDKAYSMACAEFERHMKNGVDIVTIFDENYPRLLKDISDPPLLLYYSGNIAALNSAPAVAVVGTREPTEYGAEMAFAAGEVLARSGVTVVSGLARGCDTSAHKGSISARGKTVAFVAHGLQTVYPPENAELAFEIAETGGCIATEYPLGTKMHPSFFKRRNRLQTGTSLATLVIESDLKSGTMYTAGFARQQERKLFVLNHPKERHSPSSEGNLRLLSEGYAIAVSEDEVLSGGAK